LFAHTKITTNLNFKAMKKVLALIVLCFIAFNSHAQLKYQNGYLVYNAMERYNGYMTNWEG
jgi:hypothetical protein